MSDSEKAAVKSLTGKIALITGAGSGIGRAAALLFAREGAAVAIADINQSAQAVAEEIIRSGGHAFFEPADVTQAIDCQRVVDRTLREFGGIHVLFNNAGIMRRASVTELSEQDWDRVMAVNVKSIFLMSRLVIPIMAGWWRLDHQHSFRLGLGWRAARRGLLCLEGCGRTPDQGDGDRSWSAKDSRQLYLPRRHRHRYAAR
jgi:NAD(P)-dependent dehydrogenase (short-subunit alcohol dehydrogenase family)